MSWLTEDEKRIYPNNELEDILDRVFNKAVERALALMPHALGGLLKYAVNLASIQKAYEDANPDLMEHKVRLKELIGITSSNHPDWGIDKIVEESGKDLRKELETVSSIGAVDLISLEAPSKEKLNGSEIKDS